MNSPDILRKLPEGAVVPFLPPDKNPFAIINDSAIALGVQKEKRLATGTVTVIMSPEQIIAGSDHRVHPLSPSADASVADATKDGEPEVWNVQLGTLVTLGEVLDAPPADPWKPYKGFVGAVTPEEIVDAPLADPSL